MAFRRTTLLRKGLLIILLPVLSQVALFAIVLHQQRAHTRVQDLAVHTKEVIEHIDRLVESLLVRQVDLRGRLLGLPGEPVERLGSPDTIARQMSALQALVADNPEQQAHFPRLWQSLEIRNRWVKYVSEAIDAGQTEEALRRFRDPHAREQIQFIYETMATMRGDELKLDRERIAALRRASKTQNAIIVAGLLLVVGVAGLSMWYFGMSVSRRIATLTSNVERLKRGEALEHTRPAGDELDTLDRSFHAMAAALAEARTRDHASQMLIERRNADLTRANHELAQKNQENEMFVYSVSHDLRSPLVNLQGFSRELGLVRDDLRALFDGPLSDAERTRGRQMVDRDITECIRFIQTGVMRLSTIIDALLRLSRAGRVEYRPEDVRLTAVVQRIVASMRESISQRGATVTIHELPHVWGDPAALEQIFANLIGNAVNYLDPQRPGVVEVGVLPAGESAADEQVFFVRDNGLGIAEAYLPKIFLIFQRLHEKMAPGEGIGLALVRRAVERHGGRVWVESKVGVGTTFFVALPREEKSPLKLVPRKESLSVRIPRTTEPAPSDHA